MAAPFILTNATIVTPTEVLEDSTLVIEDGLIAAIQPHSYSRAPGVLDLGGRYLLPGIVDLHNDALEKEIAPRPRAAFDRQFALLHLDRKLAAAGVTTEFHAVYFADRTDIGRQVDHAIEVTQAVADLRDSPHAAIDNQVLHRLDVRTNNALPTLLHSLEQATVPFISINDHVPGRGQFNNLIAYRDYARSFISGKATDDQVDAVIAERLQKAAETEQMMLNTLRAVAETARNQRLIIASHDDDTPEQVDLMHSLGCTVAEFPITIAAAQRARELGMMIAMGAPNVMQGRSLSGNASALDLLAQGLVDILVADYHASSLLASVFLLVQRGLADLPTATRLVSTTPAEIVELSDRGALEVGRRADLLVVEEHGGFPIAAATFLRGATSYVGGPFASLLASVPHAEINSLAGA